MAGGIGSRFWPLSTSIHPKQFIDILGTGRSLIQQTFDRFRQIFPINNIWIVTSSEYKELVFQQLPEICPDNVLLEPARRNTAPCIAYANLKIKQVCPNANIVVAPSDHLILKEEEFLRTIQTGLHYCEKHNVLLTLGIKPSRPETGYGYIQVEKPVEKVKNLFEVKTFTEKPNLEMAQFFVESGEFYWNSGIFIWSLNAISLAFQQFLPEVDTLFAEAKSFIFTERETEVIQDVYSKCKNISIDYGVMEKAKNVSVLCAEFGWSDLGTWGSLFENIKKDKHQNAINNTNVFAYNTTGTIVKIENKNIAVIEGLKDYIVVQSGKSLLICRKTEEQQIRQFVNDVKIKIGPDSV